MTPEYKNFGALNRQQKNPNPLLDNKFTFNIVKLPQTSWSCKSANIPGTSVDIAWQTSRFNPIPRNGLNLQYDPFEIQFLVDEDLNNYSELNNWMRMMSLAVTSDGYGILKLQDLTPGPDGGLVSDAQLVVLTNESIPNFTCTFRDAFPISLSELRFASDTDNPNELYASARFAYTWYDLATVEPEPQPD